jgi:hypothetical protein
VKARLTVFFAGDCALETRIILRGFRGEAPRRGGAGRLGEAVGDTVGICIIAKAASRGRPPPLYIKKKSPAEARDKIQNWILRGFRHSG